MGSPQIAGMLAMPFGITNTEGKISPQQYLANLNALITQLNTTFQMQRSMAYNATNPQSIPSASFTALTFDTNNYENGTPTQIHSTSSNTSRFTAQASGFYLAIGQVGFAANAAGDIREITIHLNGSILSNNAAQMIPPIAGGVLGSIVHIATFLNMNSADYIEFLCYQDSGGNLNALAKTTYGSLTLLSRF